MIGNSLGGKTLQHFLLDRVAKCTSLCLEQGQGFVDSAEPPAQIPEYPPPPTGGSLLTHVCFLQQEDGRVTPAAGVTRRRPNK